MTGVDRADRLLARRVDHALHPDKGQAAGNLRVIDYRGIRLNTETGERQHPHALTSHSLYLGMHQGSVQRPALTVGAQDIGAAGKQALDRALEIDDRVVTAMQGGHVLVLGLKGNRIKSGVCFMCPLCIDPGLARRYQQCSLGGVTFYLPGAILLFQHRVVAQQAGT